VQTDRLILNNKQDIKIYDNEKRTCRLIEDAISGDRNMIKEEAEKILKYKDLNTEIQNTWNMTANVIPVIIIWTIGTISKPSRQYLSNITGKKKIKALQKTALLGMAHALRKMLMLLNTFNRLSKITWNHRTAAALCTLEA
jgi:hypothetical protein